ncbi:MAG TPA: short-chain dehydrogenase [Flavisolibacter sp.]|nr:short-chain dehydrogenase [Flavisolibacter sp.]
MNTEEIQKFLDNKTFTGNEYIKITFKKREAVYGLFVKEHKDYGDLKSKNFWRIVPQSQFEAYKKTKNIGLAKIFHGSDFSKLTVSNDTFN